MGGSEAGITVLSVTPAPARGPTAADAMSNWTLMDPSLHEIATPCGQAADFPDVGCGSRGAVDAEGRLASMVLDADYSAAIAITVVNVRSGKEQARFVPLSGSDARRCGGQRHRCLEGACHRLGGNPRRPIWRSSRTVRSRCRGGSGPQEAARGGRSASCGRRSCAPTPTLPTPVGRAPDRPEPPPRSRRRPSGPIGSSRSNMSRAPFPRARGTGTIGWPSERPITLSGGKGGSLPRRIRHVGLLDRGLEGAGLRRHGWTSSSMSCSMPRARAPG